MICSKVKDLGSFFPWKKQINIFSQDFSLIRCFHKYNFTFYTERQIIKTIISTTHYLLLLWFQSLPLFLTPWTAVCQAPLSSTIFWSLLKFISIESVMVSNHLILCHPLLLQPSIFPTIGVFYSESSPCIGGQSIGAWPSASVLPMNVQGWFPLGLTGLISLLSKGLSRVFSITTVQKH